VPRPKRKDPPFQWKNDKRAAAAKWLREREADKKGPQLQPYDPTSHAFAASWQCKEDARHLSNQRIVRRFCVYPLDMLRGLPRANTKTRSGGVYFMWFGPALIYVGKSVYIGYRLSQHLEAERRKPMTHVTYLPGDHDLIRDFESDYVMRYEPPYNLTSTG
jgi:hypothetical protein